MDLRKIKKLIELLEDSELVEMEISEGENTIRLSRASRQPSSVHVQSPSSDVAPTVPAVPATAEPVPGVVIKSPLVGTFYHSASPDDKPYVTVGASVAVGDTLCLVEAMKTFNQLEAEVAGVVTVIYKNNGDPVEYGEPLFVIEDRAND